MATDKPEDLGMVLAQQIRQQRLARAWSRDELAERSGVNVYTLKHFERYGQISLERLLKVCSSLDILESIVRAFKPRQRVDVEGWNASPEVGRQRGRRRPRVVREELELAEV